MAISGLPDLAPPANLREQVVSALSAAIISGELAPGALVSVPTLAARFGVSATPVREAMLDLEQRGFVEPVRNKGFRVTEVVEADLHEIVQIRQLVEVPATASLRLPADRIAEFREKADAIVAGEQRSDLTAYLAADVDFHLSLLALTGNRRLVALVADLRSQTRMTGLAHMLGTTELAASAAEHHELLDLLVAGKTRDVRTLMSRHVGHVLGWWAGRPE
ncbi:GntR family transcriptional regulator [Fodinicola acaciae]|uniref:GntR family transcriptional regulator n=1 Tax=Fodinicola acaciae TaxID=2681555 RepID=UPI0013D62478|nr:GntR family transcriptional regulator [Fodinicola acaciae]